ncbi:MAG: Ig-like domain-containing protein, partial [Myxococcales bacterium]
KALKGRNGLNLPADKVVTFKVASEPPSVVAISPADQAQNVALDVQVTATFSEPIDTTTLSDQTFFLRDGSNNLAATVTYDAATRKATLSPTNALPEGRTYTATVTSAIKDRAGNTMTAAKTWSFSTLTTIPTVTGIVPANNASNIAGNAAIRVTFSEAMDASTFTATTFVVRQGANDVAGTRSWDDATRTAVFQPTGAYTGGSTINVRLTTGVKDRSGIALAQDFTSSFTVSTAPSVSSSTPAPGATGVALTAPVSLTFSTGMDQSTLTAANVWIEDAAGAKLAGNYTASATTLSIQPQNALQESSVYTVRVTTGVKSASGVAMIAEYPFSFTTLGVPPQVSTVSPQDNATDVAVATKIRVTFNEDMDQATFTDENLRLSDGANDLAGTVTAISARIAEFTPAAPLRERSRYTITADIGFTDVKGNALAAPFRASFTTELLPRVLYFAPAAGETSVPTNASLLFAMNKALQGTVTVTPKSGGTPGTLTLFEDGARIDGAAAYDAATLTVRVNKMENGAPATWSPGKRYTLEIDGAQLKDVNGNAVGGRPSTSFSVGSGADTTGPSVVGTFPQSGDTGVSRTAQPWADFNEPLDPSTVTSATVRLLDGTSALAGRVEYLQASRRVRFVPAQPLAANKQLTLEIGTGIKDLAGNGRAQANSIAFTTGANTAPTVARMWPAAGSTNVNVNTDIRIDFSEPINPATLQVTVTSNALTNVPGTVSYDAQSATAIFRPNADLQASRTIAVSVGSGLADTEGAATTADIDVGSFTTVANSARDVSGPSVTTTTPANNATGQAAATAVTLRFSEALDTTTLVPANFSFKDASGQNVAFSLSVDAGANSVTLTPNRWLSGGVRYDVAALAGVQDLAGNAL